ncbi:glycolate oxidase subunit GlcE [Roseateles sp. SL47]|uniref:glycolate oxidase subunit GlcE n=1 Tax=Roseateles sp. SL47 TaxID=2995138 RepID=UPI00227081D5|nr:glycolate oxidase subunit GlcE [Roseateles sp. SL47]WAC73841.1 glycolate oxidase subunit GlcE [Roseateles sp. SL47]
MSASVDLDLPATAAPTPAVLTEAVQALQARIRQGGPLRIEGHGSKHFYGGELRGDVLSTRALNGVLAYEPSELYVTAAAGTPLTDLEARLAAQGQHLAFEPPRFSDGGLGTGTVGGMVAAGLSGPARSSAGAVRDHVLGLTLINGRGELLHFGGTVMKNVAGYDVSRLMAGALGVLGLIAQVTLKVLPVPVASATLRFELPQDQALLQMNRWGGQPLPISATAWWDGALVVRLSGAEAAVRAAMQRLGGDVIPPAMAEPFWRGLRDHDDEFFIGARRAVQGGAALWRISVPATAPAMALHGEQLIEWGGAQRWVVTPMAPSQLRETIAAVGGHAVLFRARDKSVGALTPLSAPLARIHRQLKAEFDPHGCFNPGRLYPDF